MSQSRVYKKNTVILYGVIFTISIISFIAYLLFSLYFDETKEYTTIISYLSWAGILIGIYVLFSWYKLTGNLFSLYTIFILFFFLFNFGQPLMWALGIHQSDEIGQTTLYTLGRASTSSIAYTQILTLISIVMFHLGAVFCYKPRNKKNISNNLISKVNVQITTKAIFYTCFILSLFVIPISFYISVYDLIFSQSHGYSALYYDDSKVNIVAFNLLKRMFFPCLVGLLIGSNYHKGARLFVYTVFAFYLIINLLSGDRGSWVYDLVILVFMRHTFYKKIRWKQMLMGTGIGLLFLYFVNVFVELRSTTGISLKNVKESFTFNNSPIVDFIFEMGGSMRPALVLIQYDWDIWPYANSYITSFIGLLPEKVINLLGIPYVSLTSWFSQDYLGISYGAGFSIVAESLLNYGPIFAPLVMLFLGYIISSLTFLNKDSNIKEDALRIFFTVSTMSVFMSMVRGHLQHSLNVWLYSVVILFILIFFMKMYLKSKPGKKQIPEEV